MKLFDKLFDGEIGQVSEGSCWDEETELSTFNGKKYEAGDQLNDIDEFLKDVDFSTIRLEREDGYRGVGCYWGWVIKEEKVYGLDIMNDYIVYRMIEVK